MPAKAGPEEYIQTAGFEPRISSAYAQIRERGRGGAADLLGQAEAPVLGVHEGLVALLEGGRDRRGVGLRVEDRRVAVGVGEGLGELVLGEAGDLVEDALRGLDVHLRERTGAVQLVAAEHLEEVELDVAEIRLVVPHGDGSVSARRGT